MKKEILLFVFLISIILVLSVQGQGNQNNNQNSPCGNGTDGNPCACIGQPGPNLENCVLIYSSNGCLSGYANCSEVNKTIKNKTEFLPWQKRNESECPEGCKCQGAVVSCATETGKIMTIEAGRSGNIITITVDKINVDTELELEQETDEKNKTKLYAKLSNGRKAEVKIMPKTASERALERLRLKVCSEENNCSIELKEIGNKLTYEIQAERHAKLLALFRLKMKVKGQVNAETEESIIVKKPWWAFLASEPEE